MAGKGPYRADHVGSFLRPQKLRDARQRFQKGELSATELRAMEDAAIRDLVAFEEGLGLHAITDGEFRRSGFHIDFLVKLEGVEMTRPAVGPRFQGPSPSSNVSAPGSGGLPTPKVTGRLGRGNGILIEGFKFLKSVTKRTAKVTIPSPSMLHFRGGREAVDKIAYPTMEEFYADLVRVWREEINALGAAGCTYVQLDDTNLAYLCDPKHRERIESRGENPDDVTRLYAKLITDVFKSRPAGMTAAVHLCRGNARSNWMAEGGYEPVAEIMLNETGIDGFFLEYDDARSGGFEPLRFLPKGKRAVLGLITTKTGKLENADDLRRRIDEASKFAPLDQLCLSPQCGFASTEQGNLITEDEQKRKLELVVSVAEKVWGTAA